MITSSHLNTNFVLIGLNTKYLGSISGFLTSPGPHSWSPLHSSWPQWLSFSPWWPPPCPARAQCPRWDWRFGPRDKSGWCHFHPSSVTLTLCILAAITPSHQLMFNVHVKLTSQLHKVTPSGVTPDFLISDEKLSRSVITFRFLLFLRQNVKIWIDPSNLPRCGNKLE